MNKILILVGKRIGKVKNQTNKKMMKTKKTWKKSKGIRIKKIKTNELDVVDITQVLII